jgi:hypothetical protein
MELPINYDKSHWSIRRKAREQYIKQQEGKCCHCGEDLKKDPPENIMKKRINRRIFPKNFFKWPVHLHHDHNTGMTIGAIHSHCNAVLWQYHGE